MSNEYSWEADIRNWYKGPLPDSDMDYFLILTAIETKIEIIEMSSVVYTVTKEWNNNIKNNKIAEWSKRKCFFINYIVKMLGLSSKRAEKYFKWYHNCFEEYKEHKDDYFKKISEIANFFTEV